MVLGFASLEEPSDSLSQGTRSICSHFGSLVFIQVILYVISDSFEIGPFRWCCSRFYENDTLVADFTGPFSYDGSFGRMWMTWSNLETRSITLT